MPDLQTCTTWKGCPPRRSGPVIGRGVTAESDSVETPRAISLKTAPPRADIRRLGDLLGETPQAGFGGERLFEIEEGVRALCKRLRGVAPRRQGGRTPPSVSNGCFED